MESLRSPLEITTLFFVLSIGFYIFLFWRSQVAERRLEQDMEKMRIKRPSHPVATERRFRGGDRPISENTFSRIFDSDQDGDQFTNH